eukprot:16737-Heterococcus_DN1.PRE.2
MISVSTTLVSLHGTWGFSFSRYSIVCKYADCLCVHTAAPEHCSVNTQELSNSTGWYACEAVAVAIVVSGYCSG